MNFLLLIRVAGPTVSIPIESVMVACRAMIARQLRGGNDDLVRDLAGSAGDAVPFSCPRYLSLFMFDPAVISCYGLDGAASRSSCGAGGRGLALPPGTPSEH